MLPRRVISARPKVTHGQILWPVETGDRLLQQLDQAVNPNGGFVVAWYELCEPGHTVRDSGPVPQYHQPMGEPLAHTRPRMHASDLRWALRENK